MNDPRTKDWIDLLLDEPDDDMVELDYEIYDEAYWQPHRVVMKNNQNGKSSVLSFKEVKYKNGLTDRDFSQNSLKRSR